MKIHFAVRPHMDATAVPACGRGSNPTDDVRYVTCELCKNKPSFIDAQARDEIQRAETFEAQAPRQFREPWHQEPVTMKCRECGSVYFREADRTCYGHYANYVCSLCGHTESRLTETGMSF